MSQGRKENAEPALFVPTGGVYSHIPKNGFYEQLGSLLDLSFVYELTRPLYAEKMGRPSLDPVIFFKCTLVGFFENIVYDTDLEYRIADSLTIRKFLGYSLDERTPDESTLRKTRQKMPQEAFQLVFDYVLDVCAKHGLVKGRAVGSDSTLVDANASMDSVRHKELGCSYDEYVLALQRQDNPDATRQDAVRADRDRAGKASNADWQSTTDPQARIMQHSDGHTHLSYKIDASVDLQTGVIVSAGADFADVSDQSDCLERVDEAKQALVSRGFDPVAVVLDKGHHSAENLLGISERGLVPMISSPNRRCGKPGFRREDFSYDADSDTLKCPAGQVLHRCARDSKTSHYYQASGKACRNCEHFGVCTSNKNGRHVCISIYEDVILANRERVRSEEGRPLMQIRRQRGEAPFGYFKMFGGLRRIAGRGLEYALKKALIAALGWNLLLLVKSLMRNGLEGAISALAHAAIVPIQLIFSLLDDPQAQLTTWARTGRLRLDILAC